MIFGWAIPGLFGAKDMSGYWSAGRGAICCAWLSDRLPQRLSERLSERIIVPPVYSFKIDHLSILLKENGRKARFSPMSIALAHYIRLYVTCNAPCSRNIYCRKVFRDSVQISALFVFTSSKCRKNFCTTRLLFQNRSFVDFERVNGGVGAIFKKMAVLLQ